MKKYLVATVILAIFAGVIYAADTPSLAQFQNTAIPYSGNIVVTGKAPRSWHVNIDNVTGGRTLDNAVVAASGTYLGGTDNTLTPIAATIVCKSTDTYWAFQNTPTTADIYLASGSSWQPSGPDAIGYLKGITSGTDNAACSVTLWY